MASEVLITQTPEIFKLRLSAASTPPSDAPTPKAKAPRKKKPNYNLLHSKPLPVDVHPLPAFHPSNPISLLRIAYILVSQLLAPPDSHPDPSYTGLFSPETRSVHITEPKQVRALWEKGFFGKGALSRSEPSWMARETARRKAELSGRMTAEDATQARRQERKLFKLERARLEREKIERQRAIEEGRLDPAETPAEDAAAIEASQSDPVPATPVEDTTATEDLAARAVRLGSPARKPAVQRDTEDEPEETPPDFENQEHLQLTLEEAFFLKYALGVLDVIQPDAAQSTPPTTSDLVQLFSRYSCYPPAPSNLTAIAPDNQFFLNYVVYHHFRSLGWVVRPGTKFSVDYLLYNRGPVFSHAEFAVLIVPSYSHAYWSTGQGLSERKTDPKDWWWLHCVNRVQSQVKKTLVLAYVDVPPPTDLETQSSDVGAFLRQYKVREFVVRRWLANRSRD